MLSPNLATFQLLPEPGGRFLEYQPGQYIALRREECQLTRRVVASGDERRYVPDLDESGAPRIGPVTHPYSIASAPSESRDEGTLEFYVILERDAWGTLGRLSRSLFELELGRDDRLLYADRAAGSARASPIGPQMCSSTPSACMRSIAALRDDTPSLR